MIMHYMSNKPVCSYYSSRIQFIIWLLPPNNRLKLTAALLEILRPRSSA